MNAATNWSFLVNHGDFKLLIVEADVSDLSPRESEARSDSKENDEVSYYIN